MAAPRQGATAASPRVLQASPSLVPVPARPRRVRVAVAAALVGRPGDGLLCDGAALGEGDRALIESGLLGDDGVVEVDPVPGPPGLDAQYLELLLVAGGELAPHRLEV